ncbi:MAG: hypothetical protein EPN76_09470 [Burkholderiaceae bacterium]|nr:MAG: hypothetical protein EPN76_09470 [Burkholderiaceae bacterium]TAM04873.1 MAG: hypothetical protein EPN67_07490 [Pusillimonas sp.]
MISINARRLSRQALLPGRRVLARQSGQALLEGAVALLVLLVFFVGCAWLARFQDMALQASHASRFAAFSLSRDPGYSPLETLRESYFSGATHQWHDRRGGSLLSSGRSEVELVIRRSARLAAQAQPGGAYAGVTSLRREWQIEDAGIISASVAVAPSISAATKPLGSNNQVGSLLRQFDAYYPRLVRHTAILSGAGHAPDDRAVQDRVAQSDTGWSGAAENSYALARQISSGMAGVDKAWRRLTPVLDWLGPLQGHVPEHHLLAVGGER